MRMSWAWLLPNMKCELLMEAGHNRKQRQLSCVREGGKKGNKASFFCRMIWMNLQEKLLIYSSSSNIIMAEVWVGCFVHQGIKCFVFLCLIAHRSCSASVCNSLSCGDEILINSNGSGMIRWLFTCCITSWLVCFSSPQSRTANDNKYQIAFFCVNS